MNCYAYCRLGNFKEALEYCQKALGIQLNIYVENHPKVALSYNNIGGAYNSLGNSMKALEYYQKALKIRLGIWGKNHLNVAASYNNIANAYHNLGNFNEALKYHQKALNIRLDCTDENHPDVAESYNNIGVVYRRLGNFKKVLEFIQKAFVILCNTYKQPHPNIAITLERLLIVAEKSHPSQLNGLESIYPICVKTLGIEHELTEQLSQLISSKNLFLWHETTKEFHPKNTNLINIFQFPYLLNKENSLIYDLPLEKAIIKGNIKENITNESSEKSSFHRATRCLLQARTLSISVSSSDFKTSIWNPDQKIDDLLNFLKKYGPMIIGGEFGKSCYKEVPVEVDKNLLNKTIQGWQRNASRAQNPQMNFIIVVGAVKVESLTNRGRYIYFVDPSDPGDSNHSEKGVFYKISYKNLKNHTKKSELMKGYALHL